MLSSWNDYSIVYLVLVVCRHGSFNDASVVVDYGRVACLEWYGSYILENF